LIIRTIRLKKQKADLEMLQEKMHRNREQEVIRNKTHIKNLNEAIDGNELEKKQIAELLQDNVTDLLSTAKRHLYAVKSELKEKAPEEVIAIEKIISEASDKVKDLSHKLISSVLLKFGLATATEDLCEKYSNSQLVFNSDSYYIKRYEQSFEINIYNIIEELMSNTLKHSKANIASIDLDAVNGTIEISVTDNGQGFDIDESLKQDGKGLNRIRNRVKMMHGSFELKSYADTGTQVEMVIPIPD
jgi:signal transduction histidine kinase